MNQILRAVAFAAAVAATACSSTRYGDPESVETVNVDWGSTDLQTFSKKMVQSLIDSRAANTTAFGSVERTARATARANRTRLSKLPPQSSLRWLVKGDMNW